MTHDRDSSYYFNDHSVVLVVENVLFKVEASRLAIHSEVFRNMFDIPPGSNKTEGTSDANPITLPQIKAEEFRNLLYIFYQSPVESEYLVFMSGASNAKNHTPAAFKRYLDIATLAHRFCMPNVEEWAKKQLETLEELNSAAEWLDPSHLVATLAYAKLCSGVANSIFVQITQRTLSLVISRINKRRLIEFYKDFSKNIEPVIRGPLLVHMLKLGYAPWISAKLTWEQRGPLYALQAHLIPLPNTPFSTLSESNEIEASLVDEAGRKVRLCSSVLDSFDLRGRKLS